MKNEMPRAYQPEETESRWYQFWLKKGYFTPAIDWAKSPFVIVMPPPNVTGELHVGHALTDTLEDIMVRWHRMKGEPTLWLPGTDHAGIATQLVVERELAKEGLGRKVLGREEFVRRVWQWTEEHRRLIRTQHQKIGASCDWTREKFTLDKDLSRAVREAFVRLYRKGLIYRGERIINWCPRCLSAISDLEVDHREVEGALYFVRYPLVEGGYITVATTRPETMLGDVAVAVHPEDERYRGLIGQMAVLPLVGRLIPVIADEAIDPQFGTGAVKVTPGHDPVDFEIGQRHHLEIVNIFNPDATIADKVGHFAGRDRFEARHEVVEELKKGGFLEKVEAYRHSVGHCERCGTMIEPLVSQQWFVHTDPLAAPAIEAVKSGRITILPEHFTRIYLNWMEDIKDWCISRQLWWGHRIPVWYCKRCGEMTVAVEDPESCSKCGSKELEQDPDVLDTWFSSALWPHSTLGWPDDTEDFRYFYPTSVLETGYDILFFWVARMIMMGIEDTGKIPFHTVYLHGLIRDEHGDKMSKVKGNVINPARIIESYGADALRFALSTGTAPGNDIKLSDAKFEAGRNFANKLWNATRFILNAAGDSPATFSRDNLLLEDRWILSRLNRVILSTNELMARYQFGEALQGIYDFIWGEFCDWYLEMAKVRLKSKVQPSPFPVLVYVLETSLRLLHPFMPFVTEELWQRLRDIIPEKTAESIMISVYPESDTSFFDEQAEKIILALTDIIRSIRNTRAEHDVPPRQQVEAVIYSPELGDRLPAYAGIIETLAKAKPKFSPVQVSSEDGDIVLILRDAEVLIPLRSMTDLEEERKRLAGELSKLEESASRLRERLQYPEFLSKAPPEVIEKERARLEDVEGRMQRLKDRLTQLATGPGYREE